MRTCRTRAAAIAAVLAFAMTGCGGPGGAGGETVALQAVDDTPGVDGES